MSTEPTLITPSLLREWRLPDPAGSKHSRGDVLVVGGARGTPGAALLAGLAALRVGAGVATLAVAESVAVAVGVAAPEVGTISLPETPGGSVRGDAAALLGSQLDSTTAVVLGPGLDDPEQAGALVADVAARLPASTPVVLDAYALGVLPAIPEAVGHLRGHLVLTPNSTEAARLLDQDPGELADPGDAAARVADAYGAVVACQGHVADPTGGRWTVGTGHPGLGTSGSGDVLAGAIVGLLARGTPAPQAVCWATHLHSAAGDRLAAHVGRLGFLARELLTELPLVLTETQA